MQIKNVRFIIAAITTFSAYAVYVSRVNLSIAIIAMVDHGHIDQKEPEPQLNETGNFFYSARKSSSGAPSSELVRTGTVAQNLTPSLNQTSGPDPSFVSLFPGTSKSSLLRTRPLISQEKFHWDQTEQGFIMGAFFCGYILFQIPGARMAELVGARWILLVSTTGSALISLVFPLSTQLESIHLLIVLRFVMGLCQSAFFPAAYVYFCRWLPEAERSVLLPIMFIGSNMGSISTYIMSSYFISSSYGWPSVFYVSGLICLFVSILLLLFGSNGPHDNWLITGEERDYIIENLNGASVNEPNSIGRRRRTSSSCASYTQNGQHLPMIDGNSNGNSTKNNNTSKMNFLVSKCDTNLNSEPKLVINKSQSADDIAVPNNHIGRLPSLSRRPEGTLMEKPRSTIHPKANPTLDSHYFKIATFNKNANQNADCLSVEDEEDINGTMKTPVSGLRLNWCKLLSSVPVWTLIFSMYGNEWSHVVLTYELPTYLNHALNISIAQNGVLNSFLQLSYTIASPLISSLGVYMLKERLFGMRKIQVRKLFQSLATFGQFACFLSVPICGSNKGLIIMFMFAAIVFKACANAGDIMVSGDLSPEFAGTIFALANSIGNTAGFIVPLFAGYIVEEHYKREQWTPFWLTSATLMAFSGIIFLAFGETRRQNYAHETGSPTPASVAFNDQVGLRLPPASNGCNGSERAQRSKGLRNPLATKLDTRNQLQ